MAGAALERVTGQQIEAYLQELAPIPQMLDAEFGQRQDKPTTPQEIARMLATVVSRSGKTIEVFDLNTSGYRNGALCIKSLRFGTRSQPVSVTIMRTKNHVALYYQYNRGAFL